ncbi:L-aspartate oxidase [Clostridia bacterium]|nr:L-aspartate oxidase [Clostridia bacterium]
MTINTDVLIVGAGLAGLYTALNLDPALRVVIVTKESVAVSNSWMAQGGIAAAMLPDDAPRFHYDDTLAAGAGLNDHAAVRTLVEEGPAAINNLRRMAVPFDLNAEGELHITREGGHHHNRVVHAGGDATGRETVKVLAQIAMSRGNITFMPWLFLRDLIITDGECAGAVLEDALFSNALVRVTARGTVLATGGLGQVYRRTTNPAVATGDGIAAAIRAGAKVRDMEFIQFHPTGLYLPDTDRAFLISEAVRGEGARLLNAEGERFTDEMQPRDVVSRAIVAELKRSNRPCVFLDSSHTPIDEFAARFPTIAAECARVGIDPRYIPVSPAQHYLMGGVEAGLNAESSVPRLYAVGEAACTGVHGANRLASNSMLECLVFGRRAALSIGSLSEHRITDNGLQITDMAVKSVDVGVIKDICQSYAWVVRTPGGLRAGLDALLELEERGLACAPSKAALEGLNMIAAARAVFEAAILRPLSVGGHMMEEG